MIIKKSGNNLNTYRSLILIIYISEKKRDFFHMTLSKTSPMAAFLNPYLYRLYHLYYCPGSSPKSLTKSTAASPAVSLSLDEPEHH